MKASSSNPEEAKERLTKATEVYPNHPLAWFNLAWVLMVQGEYPKSEAAVLCALEIDHAFPEAWALLVYVYGRTGRIGKGMTITRRLLTDAGVPSIPKQSGEGAPREVWDGSDPAIPNLVKRVGGPQKDNPDFSMLHNNLGVMESIRVMNNIQSVESLVMSYDEIVRRQKDFENMPKTVCSYFETATRLEPMSTGAWYNLSLMKVLLKKKDEAQRILSDAYRNGYIESTEGETGLVWELSGSIVPQSDSYNETELAAWRESWHKSWRERVLSKQRLREQARQDLERAEKQARQEIQKDNKDAQAWVNLGNSLLMSGRKDEAQKAYRTAIKHKHDSSSAWMGLGGIQYDSKHYPEALDSFETAARFEPDNADAWAHVGMTMAQLGRFKGAEEAFRTAIKLKPDYAGLWWGLGTVLDRQGRHEEAQEAYERSRKLSQGSPASQG